MKMKKSLLVIVLMLAMSSLMAAMSYSSATVTSAMTGSVKSTTDSLLALNVGKHKATKIEDGVLKIDFNKGENTSQTGLTYGVQKQSEYIWNELFSIKNNSENRIDATIKLENDLPTGVKISAKVGNGTWTEINKTNGLAILNIPVPFKTGAIENKVDIKVEVAANANLGNFAPNLVVAAEAK